MNKTDKISIIVSFFSKKGQKMTNLTKVKMEKLDEIIQKYNIPIEDLLKEKQEYEAKLKLEKEEREAKLKLEKEEREAKKQELKTSWLKLTDEMRDICYDTLWEKKYKNEPLEIEKHNEELKKFVDALEKDARQRNAIIDRIDINEIRINGIIYCHDFIMKNNDKEKEIAIMKEENQQVYTYTDKDIIPLILQFIKEIKKPKSKPKPKPIFVLVEKL
jgi:hypothetical protein